MAESKEITVVETSELDNLGPDSDLYAELVASLKENGLQAEVKALLARIKGLNVGSVGVSLSAKEQKVLFKEVLESCLKQGPMLLQLDEAMEFDSQTLGSLLRTCQQMIGKRYPLALMVAGTPKLDQALARVKASFIYRTKNLYVNVLSPDATREGLSRPFTDRSVTVQDKALEFMADMTDDYPFFIQLVGAEVWDAMVATGRLEVSEETVEQAATLIQQNRNEFYQLVYSNMQSAGMVQHGHRVMQVLELNGGRAGEEIIIESLSAVGFAGKSYEDGLEILHALVDLGFIWLKDNQMEAGIPTFFKFLKDKKSGAANQRIPSSAQ